MIFGMVRLWLLILCVSRCSTAPGNLVVQVTPVVSVQLGHTAILPCWISPPQSAEPLEVRWYLANDQFDFSIFYKQGAKIVTSSGEASYVGRVSFGLKDVVSGGLQKGDVSLKLVNVTLHDARDYVCYVSSERMYDSATLRLLVTETGSSPLLSVMLKEDNTMNVSCESEGWYPQPVLRWSDQDKDLTPKYLGYDKATSGFYSVRSWLIVPSTSQVSCTVGLENKELKEGRIHLKTPAKQESASSGGGWVAFGLLFVVAAIALAVLGVMYIKLRGRNSKSNSGTTEESKSLLPKGALPPDVDNIYVKIQLEDIMNTFLTVKDRQILRDKKDAQFPDGNKVSCLTAIRGTPGFTEGKHYWEVSLFIEPVGLKHSWWIGVTSAAQSTWDQNFSPNTSNGFWFLSSTPELNDMLQFSTEPNITVHVPAKPQKVGVYLNYDGGELSFYDVVTKSLIASTTVAFRGEVFPFFNPGRADIIPMRIVHRENPPESVTHQQTPDSTI